MTSRKAKLQPSFIDGALLPNLKSIRMPLKTIPHVQRAMARTIREMRGGVIRSEDGARILMGLHLLRQSMEVTDIFEQLRELKRSREHEQNLLLPPPQEGSE